MKIQTLAMSIAAVAVSTNAFAWDNRDYAGTSGLEVHSLHNTATPGDASGWGPGGTTPGCPTGSNCDLISGTSPLEAAVIVEIVNKTTTPGPVAPGNLAYTGTQDCYQIATSDYDAGGTLISGDIGAITRRLQHLHSPTLNPAAPAPTDQTTRDVLPVLFDLCTDGEGKIESGWFGFFTAIPTLPTNYTITNFDGRSNVSFNSGSAGNMFENVPTIAEAQAVAAAVAAGNVPTPSGYGALGDWNLSAVGEINYLTCDPIDGDCGAASSKAVPVPAFAAAALGLGLVGVTVMTARRRKVA